MKESRATWTSKMYDVITVGSATIDVFVYTDKSESISVKTKDSKKDFISYPVGSKLIINSLDFSTGGGGTNSAVAISRMGLEAAYIGKVGNDEYGLKILNELKEEKVDFLGVVDTGNGKTGYSVILDSLEKRRTILSYKGVNNNLDFSEIDLGKLKTRWFYFSSMLGRSFKTLESLTDYAASNKIKICFNPSNYLCNKGTQYIRKILENTNTLVLNSEEAALLVGKGGPLETLKRLKEHGPAIVIITDGENPVHCADDKGYCFKVFPQNIKVVEATGAGDSFASTFMAGMIITGDMELSLKMAVINSHSVLKYKGAKRRLLTYKDLLRGIDKNGIRIEKNNLN